MKRLAAHLGRDIGDPDTAEILLCQPEKGGIGSIMFVIVESESVKSGCSSRKIQACLLCGKLSGLIVFFRAVPQCDDDEKQNRQNDDTGNQHVERLFPYFFHKYLQLAGTEPSRLAALFPHA